MAGDWNIWIILEGVGESYSVCVCVRERKRERDRERESERERERERYGDRGRWHHTGWAQGTGFTGVVAGDWNIWMLLEGVRASDVPPGVLTF